MITSNNISEQDLTKYYTCSKICGIVMKELFLKVKESSILNLKELENYGDTLIQEECDKIYKKEKNKGIAFPTSISLNNCVGNYLYSQENDKLQKNDVVKIELGVNLSGCIAHLGESFIYTEPEAEAEADSIEINSTNSGSDTENDTESDMESDIKSENSNQTKSSHQTESSHKKYLDLLEILKNQTIELIKAGETNDEVRIHLESKCTEYNCFPVENTISYQHLNGHSKTFESKYMILNYAKYYDLNDNLMSSQNLCFEFEENEVYTINLAIIPNNNENADETKHEYKIDNDCHIYRFNELFYNLKLKSSREFCSIVKTKSNTNAFNAIQYKNNGKHRIGIKECVDNGILEKYPIMYSKDNLPVYHKKFTIIVKKDSCVALKY